MRTFYVGTQRDIPRTTGLGIRGDYQVQVTKEHPGTVINVGCNEDPMRLKDTYGNRVINCDLEEWDRYMERPNATDVVFNCLVTPWPFVDNYAELVILGDILEHFPPHESQRVCKEALRVGKKLCVTVPEDFRIDEQKEQEKWDHDVYNLHTTTVTKDIVEKFITEAGWKIVELVSDEWGFDNVYGYCVLAERASTPAFATGGIVESSPRFAG